MWQTRSFTIVSVSIGSHASMIAPCGWSVQRQEEFGGEDLDRVKLEMERQAAEKEVAAATEELRKLDEHRQKRQEYYQKDTLAYVFDCTLCIHLCAAVPQQYQPEERSEKYRSGLD